TLRCPASCTSSGSPSRTFTVSSQPDCAFASATSAPDRRARSTSDVARASSAASGSMWEPCAHRPATSIRRRLGEVPHPPGRARRREDDGGNDPDERIADRTTSDGLRPEVSVELSVRRVHPEARKEGREEPHGDNRGGGGRAGDGG